MRLFRCSVPGSSNETASGLEAAPASRGSSLPQKILDVFFPIGTSNEVGEATHSASLKNAGGIPLLKRDGETRVPGVQHSNFPPVSHTRNLRAPLGNSINRVPQELQRLLTPTPEGLDRERDEPPAWQSPSRVPPMFAFRGSLSSLAVRISRGSQPGAALGMGDDDVPVDERIRGRSVKPVV